MAKQGISAVSMRMVTAAAGQRNNSAAQYHFGSKEGLVEAIVESRLGPINEARGRILDGLEDAGRIADVSALVDALVRPLVEATLERQGSYYARFLALSYADPQWSAPALQSQHGRAFERWLQCLHDSLPELPDALRRVRIDRAVRAVIAAIADWEAGRGTRRLPISALVTDLIETTVAGLVTPSSVAQPVPSPSPREVKP